MIFVTILVMCAAAVPVASEHGNCDAEEEVDTYDHWNGWGGEWFGWGGSLCNNFMKPYKIYRLNYNRISNNHILIPVPKQIYIIILFI